MRNTLILAAVAFASAANAQYGTFDKQAVAAAKGTITVIVQDDGNTPYDRELLNAVKANWKLTTAPEFGTTVTDLSRTPLDPTKTYLMKLRKSDPEKHDAVFLALVQGWKMKKGETLKVEDNAVMNVPSLVFCATSLPSTLALQLSVPSEVAPRTAMTETSAEPFIVTDLRQGSETLRTRCASPPSFST